RAIVFDPGFAGNATMYAAGVAGGVWKSTDSGTTWTPKGDAMANMSVGSLAISPASAATLLAGTGEGYYNSDSVRGAGIFKTPDSGGTWNQIAATASSDFYYVNKIVYSTLNPARVYAATRTGVWRSTDSGATWP